jgi:hypothetical protein
MRLRLCLTVGVLLGVPTGARAEDEKAFSCTFDKGAAFSYAAGAFKPEQASAISFEIGNINAEIQSADLVTPLGARPLRVVRAVNALHFLEVVGEGFLNMTTVYDRDDAKGAFPAVHSRHFGVLGQPVIGQYQGFCQSK